MALTPSALEMTAPVLDDVLDERLAHRHLEGVGDADQGGDGEIGVDARRRR